MRWFFNKRLSDDFVDLSIGRIRFFELSHGLISDATIKSTIAGDMLNNSLFISIVEKSIVNLPVFKINSLSVSDGGKLRDAVRKVLIRHGVLSEVKDSPVSNSISLQSDDSMREMFSEADKTWFDVARDKGINNVKANGVVK